MHMCVVPRRAFPVYCFPQRKQYTLLLELKRRFVFAFPITCILGLWFKSSGRAPKSTPFQDLCAAFLSCIDHCWCQRGIVTCIGMGIIWCYEINEWFVSVANQFSRVRDFLWHFFAYIWNLSTDIGAQELPHTMNTHNLALMHSA